MTVVRCCVAALAAVAVAGCGAGSESLPKPSIHTGGSGPLWTPPVESSSPAPSPEPSATFGPEQLEAAQTVEKFFELRLKAESDLEAPVEELATVLTGQGRTIVMSRLAERREKGVIAIGKIDSYIDGAGPVEEEGGVKTVKVFACTDSSDSDLVKSDTRESVLDASRAYFVHWKINVAYENNYSWAIRDWTSESGSRCGS